MGGDEWGADSLRAGAVTARVLLVGGGLAGAGALVLGAVWRFSWIGSPLCSVERHRSDAAEYFEQNLRGVTLDLPREARIAEVEVTHNWIDDDQRVSFTLPATRTPEAWLAAMWRDNHFAKPSHEGKYRLSADYPREAAPEGRPDPAIRQDGLRVLEYHPSEGLYVAEIYED